MRAFGWFLALILIGLAAIAAFSYPAWLLLHPHFDFPFHRIGERIGMLALLAGLVLAAPRSGSPTASAWDMAPRAHGSRPISAWASRSARLP